MPKQKMPEMAWVIPTYNREAWLASTLDSIQNQTVRDSEIIVLDDGSTDYTHELMGGYTALDDRIKYIRFNDRRGAARCRNYGNRMAIAPLVHCVDVGDMYHKISARTAINYFRKNPEVGVFYSGVGLISEKGVYLGNQRPTTYKPGTKINFSHPSVVYRQSLVSGLYRYREVSVHTDAYEAMFLEMAGAGVKFGFSRNTLVMKRQIEDDSARDMVEAHKVKRKIYDEFGLEWPFASI